MGVNIQNVRFTPVMGNIANLDVQLQLGKAGCRMRRVDFQLMAVCLATMMVVLLQMDVHG